MSTIRIRLSGATRKELEHLLGQAFRAGDLPHVRRVTVLLGLARGAPMAVATAAVGVSRATGYAWLHAFLLEGASGLRVQWRGGRPATLTATQRHRLAEIVTAGPAAAGF